MPLYLTRYVVGSAVSRKVAHVYIITHFIHITHIKHNNLGLTSSTITLDTPHKMKQGKKELPPPN